MPALVPAVLAALLALGPQVEDELVASYVSAHRVADRALADGRLAEARAGFLRCLELVPASAASAYGLACVLAREGDTEAALDQLERAAVAGYPEAALASWDQDLARLRGSPRFEAALHTMRVRGRGASEKALARIQDERAQDPALCAAVEPEGSTIAVGFRSGRILLLDALSGEERAEALRLDFPVHQVAMLPAGAGLLAQTQDGRVHRIGRDGSHSSFALDPESTGPVDFASLELDPTGSRFWASTGRGEAVLATPSGDVIGRFELPVGT